MLPGSGAVVGLEPKQPTHSPDASLGGICVCTRCELLIGTITMRLHAHHRAVAGIDLPDSRAMSP